MSATVDQVKIMIVGDDSPDSSYLEQDEWSDRLEAYRNGDFGFCGVYLEAKIKIPNEQGYIISSVRTPGLWSIESDSDKSFFRETANDEYWTLRNMLVELGIPTPVALPSEVTYA